VNTPAARIIVTTDPELDDLNSMLRLLLYSNEIDIAALVYSASNFHHQGDRLEACPHTDGLRPVSVCTPTRLSTPTRRCTTTSFATTRDIRHRPACGRSSQRANSPKRATLGNPPQDRI
jgi:hypothetical protein